MLQIKLDQPGSFSRHEVPVPTMTANDTMVRVHRIGVCGTDLHAFAGRQPFFSYPRVLGHELGVEVVDTPRNNAGIHVGDRCAIRPYLNCGTCIACSRGRNNCCENLKVLGVHIDGGMSPLLAVPVQNLHKSEVLTFDELALVETLSIGAHAAERAACQVGENALVVGAGPIGLGVIQFLLARKINVTVLDLSEHRLALCRDRLGISRIIKANAPDIINQLKAANEGNLPTIVLDATGNSSSMSRCFDLVAHGGRIVFVGLFQGEVSFDDPNFHKREITLLASRNATAKNLDQVIQALESGAIDVKPWITTRLALDDVPTAFNTLQDTPGLVKAMIDVDSCSN